MYGAFAKRWNRYFLDGAERPDDNPGVPLCLTAAENGCTVTIITDGEPSAISLEYSTDNRTYSTYNVGTTITLAHAGDRIFFRGQNTGMCDGNSNLADRNGHRFVLTGYMYASGNIMSLVDPTCASVTIPSDGCFRSLFMSCPTLLTPPLMPATTLKGYCYNHMYYGCGALQYPCKLPSTGKIPSLAYAGLFRSTGITYPPLLPSMSIGEESYSRMMQDCPNLTHASELPATTVSMTSYRYMYADCANLITGPSALPSRAIKKQSYEYMFMNCTSLIAAPEMLGTSVLAGSCRQMFQNCTSLTGPIELMFTSMGGDSCIRQIFEGCTSLDNIKVHFTNWTNGYSNAATRWVRNIASSGTFVCPSSLDTSIQSDSRVPIGWTIETFED